ncbi:type-F conjugative transfer system secretin TraK [Xenorhabdus sp. XENO-1]|nr:type-F conjugative transfer system secretin TraK [Xenorhabdus bovienii]MCP9269141.1 type-F conjugative transfer system secretin TraK [Xenorhabdus bovienii subsp. africana]
MKINKSLLILCYLLPINTAFATSENTTSSATIVSLSNGGQANIALSKSDPNLFTVAGDRITAINSLDGQLTRQEQTDSGGIVIATLQDKPFTFIIETERGLNFSIRAVPRQGSGRTIQLVSELSGTGNSAKTWEESVPYETMLVTLNRAIHNGNIPDDYRAIPVTNETLAVPSEFKATAKNVWVGHHLKVVQYSVENKLPITLNVKESDFWQPGTRAVMFNESTQQIIGAGRMLIYVTSSEENR